jgi:alkanesulfonate monooxygenase SsuD/methylene tetrahydromethanopterin reductase-like flavin-dependent oxidoreductase (luciferase family)
LGTVPAAVDGGVARSRPLRFGIMTSQFDDWPNLVTRWRRFERLPIDTLWIGDHLWSGEVGGGVDRPRFDAWVALTSLATVTTRVRVGTLVSSTAYRNPAVTAKQAITVDHISGGRLDIGVGAGANPRDAAASGLPNLSSADRSSLFAESVRVLCRLLVDDRTTDAGRWFTFDDVLTAPRPIQRPRPPLLVAAHADATLRVAAEFGDGWCSYAGRSSPGRGAGPVPSAEAVELTRQRIERLGELAIGAGRDASTMRRVLLAGFTDDRWLDSRDSLIDAVSRYREIGVDEFVFPFPTSGVDQATFERTLAGAITELRPDQ